MALTYTLITSTTTGSDLNGVTFSSVPQTYTDLVLVIAFTEVTTYGDYTYNLGQGNFAEYDTFIYGDFVNTNGGGVARGNISGPMTNLNTYQAGGGVQIGVYTMIPNYADSNIYKTAFTKISGSINSWANQMVFAWYTSSTNFTTLIWKVNTTSNMIKTGSVLSLYGVKRT